MLGVNQVYYHATRAERNQIVEYYLTAVGLSGSFNKRPDEHREECVKELASLVRLLFPKKCYF